MSKAYLKITLHISEAKRPEAAKVCMKYKQPFLDKIKGAISKELSVRPKNIILLHGFNTTNQTERYLSSELFIK